MKKLNIVGAILTVIAVALLAFLIWIWWDASLVIKIDKSPVPNSLPIPQEGETTASSTASVPISTPTTPPVIVSEDPHAISADNIFRLVNEERVKVGLTPLKRNVQLDHAADAKLADMIANNYWAHKNPNFPGWSYFNFIIASGYKAYFGGENLGRFWASDITPEGIVAAWVASPAHYGNIVETNTATIDGRQVSVHYEDAGIAVRFNVPCIDQSTGLSSTCVYVAQEFGSPR